MRPSKASVIAAAIAVVLSLGWSVPAPRRLPNRDREAGLMSADRSFCLAQMPGLEKGVTASSSGRRSPSTPSGAVAVITHGLRTKRKIALTFDACSTGHPSHYDEKVTRVLLDTNTPATVFLGGKWVEDEKEHAKYLASLPFIEIGNHTYDHPHLTRISEESIRDEIERTQQALLEITGRKAILFRPPYGEYDERVVKIAARMGLVTIEYDLASGDPDRHATKEKLVEYVTSMARSGSIIVMHINQRGWHAAEALPEIIAILRKRGYKLVTVGELLSDLKKAG